MQLFLCYLFVLFDFNVAQNTQNPSMMQRRFMWKQMDTTMDGIMNSVSTGTQAVKNMIGEFLPLVQTTAPSTDYGTSTTTRIKYIIKKPTPMKIIKVRSPMKITKILTIPTSIATTTRKINKFNELYTESLAKNKANLYSTDAFKSQPIMNMSAFKSSAMSKLHTNILQDNESNDHVEEDDIATDSSLHVNKYSKKPKPNANTYEVVENIEENETDAFHGLSYTSKQPYTTTTTTTTNTFDKTTDSPIITTTYIGGRHKKLRDQKLLTTPDTFLITDSWQPSFGFQASTKPHVVWRHENWTSADSVGETEVISSIPTFKEKPKRRKNHAHKRLKGQEKIDELLHPQQELAQPVQLATNNTRIKQQRGSIKFGDRINSK